MDIYSTDGNHIKTFSSNFFFGEVTMMGLEPERTATIVARTDCELLCLDHKDMLVAFRHYPEVMEHIIEGARQKYNKLKKIDEKAFTPKARDNFSSGSRKERRISLAFNSPNGTGPVSPSPKKKERRLSVAFNSPNGIGPVSPSTKKKSNETKEVRPEDDHNRVSELLKQLEVRLDRKLQVYSQELRSSIEDIKNELLKQLEVRLGRKLHVYSQELRSAIEDIKKTGKDIQKMGKPLSQRKSRRIRAVNKSDQTVDQKQKKNSNKSDQTVNQRRKKVVNKSDHTVNQKQKKAVNKSDQTVNQTQQKAVSKSHQIVNQTQQKAANKSDQTVDQKQKNP
jgi:CRP-like cAMP-binding protein